MKTPFKIIVTGLILLVSGLIAGSLIAQDTIVTPGPTVEGWMNIGYQILAVFGVAEIVIRFFTKYRGILGTVIRILVWIEDKTQRKTAKIVR